MNFNENITRLEALELMQNYGAKYYKFLPNSLRNDKEILLLAIPDRWQAFIFAGKELKRDRDVIAQAVKYSANVLNYANKKLLKDPDFANKLIEINTDSIKFVRTDAITRENAKKVAASPNIYLHLLAENYRKDPEIVSIAVKSNWQNVYAARVFNREIALDAVAGSWNVLSIIPEQFKCDQELFEVAYTQNKWAIKYFPLLINERKNIEYLIKNKEFDYRLITILPKWVRNDEDLVKKLIKNQGLSVVEYVSPQLKQNKELILFILDAYISGCVSYSCFTSILDILATYWQKDKDILFKTYELGFFNVPVAYFILDLLNNSPDDSAVRELLESGRLQSKLAIARAFDYRIVAFLPQKVQDDKSKMQKFVENKGVLVLRYVSQRLQSDRDFVLFALKNNHRDDEHSGQNIAQSLSDIMLKVWAQDKEIILQYFSILSDLHCEMAMAIYQNLSREFQQDFDIILSLLRAICVSERKNFYQNLPTNISKNEAFCVRALQIAPEIFGAFDIRMQVKYLGVMENSYINNVINVTKDVLILESMPDFVRENAAICLRAIERNRLNIQFVSDKLLDNKDFMREAIKLDCTNYYHTSKRLEDDEELKELAKSLGCRVWNK